MKIKIILILLTVFSVILIAQKSEDSEQAVEEQTMMLKFKDINVFEYDLDVVFEKDDEETIWFSEYRIDLEEYDLYTVEDHDGFPEYHINENKIGNYFNVTYIEIEIEGEFSGEMEMTLIITGLEEVEASVDEGE